jgi:hypothetical protein
MSLQPGDTGLRAALFTLPLLLAATLLGQNGFGVITGTVFDPLGAPFSDAEVQAKNTTTGVVYRATSASKGEYSITGIVPGTYTVTVLVRGAPMYTHAATILEASKPLRLDVRLEEGTALGAIGDNLLAFAVWDRRPVPQGPTPRSLDGKPDLSGVWTLSREVASETPALLPGAAAVMKQRSESNYKDNPVGLCLPWGLTFDVPAPFRFVQSPSVIVILFEHVFSYRQIFLDGRGHSKDADPTWMGHSVGRWDGDTLLIDTAGFNDKSWTPARFPHTEKLHMIERIRRPDLGHLEIETTFDDPGTYAKPWTSKRVSNLFAGEEIGEYICAENNQDVEHLVGK